MAFEKFQVSYQRKIAVEKITRQKEHSRIWFQMRTGRVTASKFKAACRTDQAFPSFSMIISSCYPELSKFSTEATNWGFKHEDIAKAVYADLHQNFKSDVFWVSHL